MSRPFRDPGSPEVRKRIVDRIKGMSRQELERRLAQCAERVEYDGRVSGSSRTSGVAGRTKYHVTPGARGGWDVKREGVGRVSSHHEKKDQAVDRARDLAKSETLGQVIVHRQDGTIQTEHTYGKDPVTPKG